MPGVSEWSPGMASWRRAEQCPTGNRAGSAPVSEGVQAGSSNIFKQGYTEKTLETSQEQGFPTWQELGVGEPREEMWGSHRARGGIECGSPRAAHLPWAWEAAGTQSEACGKSCQKDDRSCDLSAQGAVSQSPRDGE